MFKKLLRYDIKAISRFWWIGAVVSLGSGFVGALLMRGFIEVIDSDSYDPFVELFAIFGMIAALFCILAMVLSFFLTTVLVFARFYKHLFTDEGYLTFTLPVSRSSILLSKTVNAVIWFSLHSVVLVVSFLLFFLIVIPPEEGAFFLSFEAFKFIGDLFVGAWETVGGWLIVYILEALIFFLFSTLFSISLIHFCIAFASSLVKKAKVLVAIGIYYAVSSVQSMILQFIFYLYGGILTETIADLMQNSTPFAANAAAATFFLAVIAAFAAVAFILYSVTQYLIDRKLNLA